MNIIFIGAPGSGKGTQSRYFIEKFSFVQLSTGDLLRSAINEKNEIGLNVKRLMDQGKLVPDEIIIKLVEDFMFKNSEKSIIFDGFPRTINQAESLNLMLEKISNPIKKVVYFKINPQILIKRLTGRRTCSQCGEIFHIDSKPSSKSPNCEKCGGVLIQRPDDREEVIGERLAQFENNTGPTVNFYKAKKMLIEIDGSNEASVVYNEILKVLDLAN